MPTDAGRGEVLHITEKKKKERKLSLAGLVIALRPNTRQRAIGNPTVPAELDRWLILPAQFSIGPYLSGGTQGKGKGGGRRGEEAKRQRRMQNGASSASTLVKHTAGRECSIPPVEMTACAMRTDYINLQRSWSHDPRATNACCWQVGIGVCG